MISDVETRDGAVQALLLQAEEKDLISFSVFHRAPPRVWREGEDEHNLPTFTPFLPKLCCCLGVLNVNLTGLTMFPIIHLPPP